jgi:hypothetical protein
VPLEYETIDLAYIARDVVLSMMFNDATKEISATVSLDAGASVCHAFDPIAAPLDEGVFAEW